MNRDAFIAGQKDQVKAAIGRYLGKGQDYALIDFPHHSNVGDSAIWLGEIEIMREIAGRLPVYVSTKGADFSVDALKAALPEGPIFIHGGGNFGDVWSAHQDFRLAILRAFPDRQVIQLPQSIHFSAVAARDETARVIAAHGQFVMMVRDRPSVDLVESAFDCPVELLPDCAFGMGPIARTQPIARDVLFLMRTDKERVDIDPAILEGFPDSMVCDWLGESRKAIKRVYFNSRSAAVLKGRFAYGARRVVLFQNLAQNRVDRGLALIDGSTRVLTDRLHVHILSTLLGVPHVTLDNHYGKIAGYINQWTSGLDIVHKATTPEDAIARLRALPGRGKA